MRTIGRVAAGLALVGMMAACGAPTPKEHAYPAWNFAISLAGTPKETPTKANGPQPASFLVVSSAGGHDYSVNVIDASSATVPPDELLRSAPAAIASSMGVDEGPATYAATGDVTGREVLFEKNGKPAMLDRFFVAGGKLYEISSTVPAGAADPAAKAFLDSFRLLTPPPPAAPPAASNAASNATSNAANAAPPTNAG